MCEPVGDPYDQPFGRKIRLGDGTEAIEWLLHASETAMRVVYRLEDGGIPGVFNYIATTFVDTLSPERCRMTFSSMLDCGDEADPEALRALITNIYRAIASGIENRLSLRS